MNNSICCVVPNWNGKDSLKTCLDSLLAQSLKPHVIVVDNGSVDDSVSFIEQFYPEVEIIRHTKNLGYAGGVNPGFRKAQELGATYVAPFNNDAVADEHWLKFLSEHLNNNPQTGIAACKLMSADKLTLDSTGEQYTSWGLPFPRGRGEPVSTKYDSQTDIFGASGGASLYRVAMLNEIGLLDEDFFAYYEDVDLSWRAQLAGWKVAYVPGAIAYHQIGVTSDKMHGFTTYQTMKNLPWLLWKNVPLSLLPTIWPRFFIAHLAFFFSAMQRRQTGKALKGVFLAFWLFPKKLVERRKIQKHRKVPNSYIRSLLIYDLPPKANKLRRLRATWWNLIGRKPHI